MAQSEFGLTGGSAGSADQKGLIAAYNADGLLQQADIDTKHATDMAATFSARAADLHKAKINDNSFAGGTAENSQDKDYHDLLKESSQYLVDVSRLTVAESNFNEMIEPANRAIQSMKQLEGASKQLGFGEGMAASIADTDVGIKLNAGQKKELGNVLEDPKLAKLDSAMGGLELTVEGSKTKLMAMASTLQGDVLAAKAIAEKQLADAAADDKTKVQKQKDKTTEAYKDVLDIIKLAKSVAVAPDKAAEKLLDFAIDKGGNALIKLMVGAEFDGQIQQLDEKIDQATTNAQAAAEAGADLHIEGTLGALKGEVKTYQGAVMAWSIALADRKSQLAAAAKTADKKAPDTAGNKDPISQVMVLVSDARDAQSFIRVGKDAAGTAKKTVDLRASEIAAHRNKAYAYTKTATESSDVLYDGDSGGHDALGGDLKAVQGLSSTIQKWMAAADKGNAQATAIQEDAAKLSK